MQLSIILLIPGELRGIDSEKPHNTLMQNLSIFSILLFYPIFSNADHLIQHYLKNIIIGFFFGTFTGTFGAFFLRLTKFSDSWTIVEVLGTTLVCAFTYIFSFEIHCDEVIALFMSAIVLSKYVFISEDSLVIRNNFMQCTAGLAEIGMQMWLGASLQFIKFNGVGIAVAFILVFFQIFSYFLCFGLGYLCKLQTFKLKDSFIFAMNGFRGAGTLLLAREMNEPPQSIFFISCITLQVLSSFTNLVFPDSQDQVNYLVSNNFCSKLKNSLKIFEETYILPIFHKETTEIRIVSPKFNENSQRFDSGIQLRQEPHEDTVRILQTISLNITETESNLAFQLK